MTGSMLAASYRFSMRRDAESASPGRLPAIDGEAIAYVRRRFLVKNPHSTSDFI
jgi:hypothetical protein